ncbi:MAG: hypothetical protein Q9178_003065 [Gyalolechia marmorata]
MTRYNVALLSLLASTAYAVPHYNQHGHKHPVYHKSGPHPSGVLPSGSGGMPIGGPTAPYGTANSTIIASTGSAPFTSSILSTVTVIPQPEATTSKESPVESTVDNSPVGGTSAPGGECGPATVTVTNANTITVTVPASSVDSPVQPTSAPYGNSTTTTPIGTGTAPIYPSSMVPEVTTSSVFVEPIPESTSAVYEQPTAAQSSSLATSASEASPETATTSSVRAGEFFQAPTTPEAVPNQPSPSVVSSPEESASEEPSEEESVPEESVPEESAPEEPESTPETPESPVKPSTDNVVPRGLVYNEASLTSSFGNANVGWAYNWDSAPGGTIDSSLEFVPMLWNTSQVFHVPHWNKRAEAAIAAGSKHLLAFNEPDLPAQANMDVDQSVAGWMEYMEPFHAKHNGEVKLGSPSVCNGPEEHLGLSYLQDFLSSCGGCHVDFISIHWYGLANKDGVQHLKDHIGKAKDVAAGRPIWLTEFKPDGDDGQQAEFLAAILPWLDDASNGVARYAYFKADNMVNGDSLTQAGSAYAA